MSLLSTEAEVLSPLMASPSWNSLLGEEGNESFRQDEVPKMEPEEDIGSTMLMPACKEHRQEKQLEKMVNDHWFGQWRDTLQRVQLCGPGPGFSKVEWMMLVCYLELAPQEEGPGNAMEKA
jgi:hypothetical protein